MAFAKHSDMGKNRKICIRNISFMINRRLSQQTPMHMASPVPSVVKGHPGVTQHQMLQRCQTTKSIGHKTNIH